MFFHFIWKTIAACVCSLFHVANNLLLLWVLVLFTRKHIIMRGLNRFTASVMKLQISYQKIQKADVEVL